MPAVSFSTVRASKVLCRLAASNFQGSGDLAIRGVGATCELPPVLSSSQEIPIRLPWLG